MVPEREELMRILAEAADIKEAVEREAYLDKACHGDPDLRARIELLLKAHESAGDFLDEPVQLAPDSCDSIQEGPGTIIGHYKLLEEIGEGGFGVVFMAEQVEPIRRKVALKIVKPGMDTKQVIARFEAERQALAMMDHPNIAQVYDAGATESGRPYFVMELVHGVPVTQYCDANVLSPNERLRLFMSVCSAVQHAHQKGIIHRDIKPTNILVTLHDGKPVPKVIDFGTAKAVEEPLTEKTMFTAYGRLIGTPQYMSPEQAEFSGLDVDTRADIYSLGVLLYELLTGTTPFEAVQLRAAAFEEMMRIIRQDDPPKPSTRVSTLGRRATEVAKHRQVDPNALQRSLRGDLDWIVMKTLEKDRTRRYETANDLSEDIQRHLDHHPVLAGPPSAAYRARKYVRRHRMGVAVVTGVAAAVIVGLVFSLIGFNQARLERDHALAAEAKAEKSRQQAEAERQKAQTEAARSTQVSQFMKKMLAGVGPSVARGRDTAMLKEILDQTAERLGEELADQPEVELELRHTIAKVYWELGANEDAISAYRKVVEMTRSLKGSEDPSLATVLYQLAECLRRNWQPKESEQAAQEALIIFEGAYGHEHAFVGISLTTLGNALAGQAMLDEGEALVREALVINRKTLGNEHPQTGLSLSRLGMVLEARKQLTEAEEAYRKAIAIQKKAIDKPSEALIPEVELGWTLNNLARVLIAQNEWSEVEAIQREALETIHRVLPREHPDVLMLTDALAELLANTGKLAEAEAARRELLATQRKTLGDEHFDVADTLADLAMLLLAQGKTEEAEAMHHDTLVMRKSLLLENAKSRTADDLNNIAWLLATCDDALLRNGADAAAYAEKAVEITDRRNPAMLNTLAAAYAEAGQFTNAVSVQKEAIALLEDDKQKQDYEYRLRFYESRSPYREGDTGVLLSMGKALYMQDKMAEAVAIHRAALAWERKTLGNRHARIMRSLHRLGFVLEYQGELTEAEAVDREAQEMLRKLMPDDHRGFAALTINLTRVLGKQGKFAEAEAVHRAMLVELRSALDDKHFIVADSLDYLAMLLLAQGKAEEAEAVHHESLMIRKNILLEKAKSGNAEDMNEIAWLLATCDDASLRNGADAVSYAEKAVEITDRRKASMLNTLAAAYAEAGQFTNAVNVQKEAIALLEDHSQMQNYAYRLRFYESRSPYREGNAEVLRSMGQAFDKQGKLAQAEAIHRAALAWERRTLGNRHLQIARALHSLGFVLFGQGKLNEAEAALREALVIWRELLPDDHPHLAILTSDLALLLSCKGRLDEARTLYLDVLEQCGADAGQKLPYAAGAAQIHGRLGEWDEAVEILQICIEAEPDNYWLWYETHAAALAAGQEDVAGKLCREMLSRFADTQDSAICEGVAVSVLLSPDGSFDLGRAVEMADRAFQRNPGYPRVQIAKGMAEYRLDHYTSAAELLEPLSNDANPKLGCLAGYYLAMSLEQQGDTTAAQRVLRETNDRMADVLRAGDLGEILGKTWHDYCRNLVARSEAEQLILGKEVSPPVTAESLAAAYRVREPVVRLLWKGYSLAQEGKWKESAGAYAAALQYPDFHWDQERDASVSGCLGLQMGMAFVRAGDRENHERLCRLIMDAELSDPSGPALFKAMLFARLCFLNGSSLPDDLQAFGTEMNRYAIDNNGEDPWTCLMGGIVEYYVGDAERSLELLQKAEEEPSIECKGAAMTYRAMGLKKLGRDAESADLFEQAEGLLAEPITIQTRCFWWDLEFCQMALDEARAMIEEPARP